MVQDICWFKVAVNHPVFDKFFETIDYLGHDVDDFVLLKHFLVQQLLEIAILAKFSDDIERFLRGD